MASPIKKSKSVTTESTTENTTNNSTNSTNAQEVQTVEEVSSTSELSNSSTSDSTFSDLVSSVSPYQDSQDENASLRQTVEFLRKQLEELTEKISNVPEKKESQVAIPVPVPMSNTNDTSTKLLEYLTNKKSDKEVVLVHGQELGQGLSTAIKLTGMEINFHSMGEERVLSWQQFEECVSKYKSWFNRRIIMLSYEDRELAERYQIPYVGQDGKMTLTKDILKKLPTYTVPQLEDLFKALNKEDQNTLCSYWIGKCYENTPGFYDRYKVDCLHRISGCGAFENVIVNMNYDFKREQEKNIAPQQVEQKRNIPRMSAVEF